MGFVIFILRPVTNRKVVQLQCMHEVYNNPCEHMVEPAMQWFSSPLQAVVAQRKQEYCDG